MLTICWYLYFVSGCVNIWDTKVLRSGCGGHFKLRIKNRLDWKNIHDQLISNSSIFIADNKILVQSAVDPITQESSTTLPVLPYYGVNFSKLDHIVLILGGETEGISEECYKFVAERNGVRLNVPLNNDVDSLNINTALGVIAFEIKRQFSTS